MSREYTFGAYVPAMPLNDYVNRLTMKEIKQNGLKKRFPKDGNYEESFWDENEIPADFIGALPLVDCRNKTNVSIQVIIENAVCENQKLHRFEVTENMHEMLEGIDSNDVVEILKDSSLIKLFNYLTDSVTSIKNELVSYKSDVFDGTLSSGDFWGRGMLLSMTVDNLLKQISNLIELVDSIADDANAIGIDRERRKHLYKHGRLFLRDMVSRVSNEIFFYDSRDENLSLASLTWDKYSGDSREVVYYYPQNNIEILVAITDFILREFIAIRRCKTCGKFFFPATGKNLYCSSECGIKGQRKAQNMYQSDKLIRALVNAKRRLEYISFSELTVDMFCEDSSAYYINVKKALEDGDLTTLKRSLNYIAKEKASNICTEADEEIYINWLKSIKRKNK